MKTSKRIQVAIEGVEPKIMQYAAQDYHNVTRLGRAPFIRERIIDPYIKLKEMGIDINNLLEAATKSDDRREGLIQLSQRFEIVV